MNILVLGGGDSPEREVSLRSAKAVTEACREAGFNVLEDDPAQGVDKVLRKIQPSTIVFPILHGKGGEDGSLQAALEAQKIPFLGSGAISSVECFDKWRTRQVLTDARLPVAEGHLVTARTYREIALSSRPHVLKVVHGGSSIGTAIIRDPSEINQSHIDEVFTLDDHAVLEELVEGVEITVPILDQAALPVIEIAPPEGLEFDYENKYNGVTAEICPPQNLSEELQQKARELAEKAHQAMDCRHLSRVDMIVRPTGEIILLEINTIPGLTDQSLYPKSAAVAGLSMPALVKKFVQMVERDYNL